MKPAVFEAPPPPLTAHDARVDAVSRRVKKALVHSQKETEVDMLEDLLQDCGWSKHTRDDIVRVVDSSHRQNAQQRFCLITCDPNADCKVKLAFREEEHLLRRKGPPPMWTSPTPVKGAPLACLLQHFPPIFLPCGWYLLLQLRGATEVQAKNFSGSFFFSSFT